jgi:enamine deaminase RidA (YjgF/YER057c/UK114 family)
VLLAVAAEFLQDPFPAWTAVGVTELIDPEAVIEISCVAVFP